MRGVGIVFSRFLEVDLELGVVIGMLIVLFYAVLGGMKGITYTQVAQYCVLIFAFMVPAIFISIQMTGNLVPQLGFGGEMNRGRRDVVRSAGRALAGTGVCPPTRAGRFRRSNMLCITAALMLGTAGLPHVIVRFYTVKRVKDARTSAFWALLFIAILYTAAPAVAVFARTNLMLSLKDRPYAEVPGWFKNWEQTGLVGWLDKNGDGKIQYKSGAPFEKASKDASKLEPEFLRTPEGEIIPGALGQAQVQNTPTAGRTNFL